MKVVRIFVKEDSADGIWSIHFDNERQNEFDSFFDQMNDIPYLHKFFEENKIDLWSGFFGNITTAEAVQRTLSEVEEVEAALYNYTEHGFTGNGICLQHLFKPLNNFEYAISSHQKSKARLKRSWLRIYAIRLDQNCYLVTGGAIKITYNMERIHLQKELLKLERAKTFLRNNGIEFPEDINIHHDE
jgi:hypothetical protein